MTAAGSVRCSERLELTALRSLPVVTPGMDLAEVVSEGLCRSSIELRSGDVLVVASKLVSRAEGRFVDLAQLAVSARSAELGRTLGLDPAFVELVLSESCELSRTAPGLLITRSRHGVVCANAGVDLSNAEPPGAAPGTGPWALRLPQDPDASAEALRSVLAERCRAAVGVIVSDSVGRPFRLGSVGIALGVAGVPALFDQRGAVDLFGRRLEHTVTALADQIATAADLLAGQADEGRGVVHVRGLEFELVPSAAKQLLRAPELDLYAGLPGQGAQR